MSIEFESDTILSNQVILFHFWLSYKAKIPRSLPNGGFSIVNDQALALNHQTLDSHFIAITDAYEVQTFIEVSQVEFNSI